MDAFKLILVSLAGWMNRQQQHVIEYLQVEVSILIERASSGLSFAFPCAFRPPGVPVPATMRAQPVERVNVYANECSPYTHSATVPVGIENGYAAIIHLQERFRGARRAA